MAKTVTTTKIESDNRVFGSYDAWDFLFMIVVVMISYGFKINVHPKLRMPFIIFNFLIALFLTSKSGYNKKRKNYESLYFLINKDLTTYRPFFAREKGGKRWSEKKKRAIKKK